ncbi:MAG: tetratricopeptide repeat protein [Phycisphaeraceae bacterium]|nr:tetratricopeptide repeat protein [Phycisphaeraceae bacterium]
MAARINFRLLLILIIVLGSLGATVGVVLFIRLKYDAERHIVAGDRSMAEGDVRAAVRNYRRGIAKDRLNLEYVAKLRDAILQVVPTTEIEARDYFVEFVNSFGHATIHYPSDARYHVIYLEHVHAAAGAQNAMGFWDLLETTAQTMLDRVSPSDPLHVLGYYYRGAARVAPSRQALLEPSRVEGGFEDLARYIEATPGDARAWGAVIQARAAMADRARPTDQQLMRQQLDHARQAIRDARSRGVSGPPLVVAMLEFADVESRSGVRPLVFSDEDRVALARDLMNDVDRITDPPQEGLRDGEIRLQEPGLLIRAMLSIDELRAIDGSPDLLRAVERLVERDPTNIGNLTIYTQVLLSRGRFEDAERAAERVLALESQKVSLDTMRRWQLQRLALAVLVDTAVIRWEQSGARSFEGGVPTKELTAIRNARERLRQMTSMPDDDSACIYADARLAFAEGDFRTAAAHFDRLVRESRMTNPQVLVYSAVTLERQGQLGLARERVEGALASFPENATLLRTRLRIVEGLRDDRAIRDTAERLLRVDPESAAARAAMERVAAAEGGRLQDPLAEDLRRISPMIEGRNWDAATAAIESLIAAHPGDLRLLRLLADVRFSAGDRAGAKAAVRRALELSPGNRLFEALLAVADITDEIESIDRWWEVFEADEKQRVVSRLLDCTGRLERTREAIAQTGQGGPAGDLESLRALESRLEARRQELLAEAIRQLPDDPRLIEYRFSRALIAGDLEQAQRLVADARRANADLAGGEFYEGRLRMARRDYEGAIRALRETVTRIPYSSEAYLVLAGAYVSVGNVDEALRSYEQSRSINPSDLRPALALADAYRQLGRLAESAAIMREAVRIRPGDLDLWNRWLTAEELAGNRATVIAERRRARRDRPDDAANAVALVVLLERNRPERATMLDAASGEPRFSPERWNLLGSARQREEIDREQTAWRRECDTIIEQFSAGVQEPLRALGWAVLRADTALGRGRGDEAEEILRTFAQTAEGDARLLGIMALGEVQRRRGRLDSALVTFRSAADQGFAGRPEIDWYIGSTLQAAGRAREAIPPLERVRGEDLSRRIVLKTIDTREYTIRELEMQARDIELTLVELLRRVDRLVEARRRFESILPQLERTLAVDGLEIDILNAEADAAWLSGDPDAARAAERRLDAALDAFSGRHPVSELAALVRANRRLQEFRRTRDRSLLDQARIALAQAQQLAPRSAALLRLRYQYAVESDAMRDAEMLLREALTATPQDETLRRLLVDHLVRAREYRSAVAVAQEGAERAGGGLQAVGWHLLVGDLNGRRGEHDAAIAAVAQAYQIEPTPMLLARLCTTILAKPGVQARDYQRVHDEIRRNPQAIQQDAFLRQVYARSLYGLGRGTEGIMQLRESYAQQKARVAAGQADPGTMVAWVAEMKPTLIDATPVQIEATLRELAGGEPDRFERIGMARIWTESGAAGASRAVDLLESVLSGVPAEDERLRESVLMEMGNAALRGERYADAVRWYEQVVRMNPNQFLALNNLAYTLAEKLDRPAEARPHARRAVALQPGMWSLLDTAGRVAFLLGEHAEAVVLLERSVAAEAHPTNLAHLADAYLARGDEAQARRSIERAEELLRGLPVPDADGSRAVEGVRARINAKSAGR